MQYRPIAGLEVQLYFSIKTAPPPFDSDFYPSGSPPHSASVHPFATVSHHEPCLSPCLPATHPPAFPPRFHPRCGMTLSQLSVQSRATSIEYKISFSVLSLA